MPSVKFIEMVEFLVRELEMRIEFDHMMEVLDWVFDLQKELDTTLTTMSPVFVKRASTSDEE